MESRYKLSGRVSVLILFFFVFSTGSCLASQADSFPSSYCCSKGKVYSSDSKQCSKQKKFYQTKKEAMRNCSNSTSSGKLPPASSGKLLPAERNDKIKPGNSPVIGYCCLQGDVDKMSEKECKRKKGNFSTSMRSAQKACNDLTAFCCNEGEVEKSTVGTCSKQKEKYYFDQKTAAKACGQIKGFCCAKGEVTATTKRDCDRLKGGFNISRGDATNQCLDTKGFCVVGGKIKNATKRECLKKKGNFAVRRVAAVDIVNALKGYCCEEGRVVLTINSICKKKHGEFFLKRNIALKKCQTSEKERFSNNIQKPGKTNRGKKPRVGEGPGLELPSLTGARKVDAGALVKPDLNPPEIVPLSIHGDINILNPAGGERYYKGETVPVLFRFSGVEPTSGEINVVIMNRTAIVAGSTTVPAGSRQAYVDLRESAPNGQYFVMITYAPPAGELDEGSTRGVLAESRLFSLHRNSGRIDFLSPDGDTVIHPGGTMDVNYKLNRRVESGPITFSLYHAGAVVAEETVDYFPAPAYRTEIERSFTWRVPGGLADSDQYVIMASHSTATGMSQRLAVRPIRVDGSSERPFDLRISEVYREADSRGRVIARIIASSGFVSGTVDLNVNAGGADEVVSERVVSGDNEIVVGEMPEPVVMLGMDHICAGIQYRVTIDPADRYSEIDETNNTAVSLLHSVEELFDATFLDTERHSITSRSGTVIPCDYSDSEYRNASMMLYIKNCGSMERVSGSDIVVRQAGRRRISGSLGMESFDEEVTHQIYYDESLSCSAREPSIPAGRRIGCIIARLNLSSLTPVNSTLTFSGSPLETPYTVDLRFGEMDHFGSGECEY